MKFFVMIGLCIIWAYMFGHVYSIHDKVHQTTMRTVYDVQLDYFEIINNTETVVKNLDIRIKKLNRTTYVLTGSFETVVEFNDVFTAIVIISALQGNEYKVIVPAKNYELLCTYLGTEKMVYPEIHAHSNFPTPGECPGPAGKYTITNYVAENTQLPELPSAGEKWKSGIILTYKNKPVIAVSIYAILIPRKVRVDD